MTLTVDEYVQANIRPEQQDIVAMLRALMRECAPGTTELISYGMPVYKTKRMIIAYINASKTHITFSFTLGVQFTDTYGLLKGRGKHARYVKIKRLSDVNMDALRDYVSQALTVDAR
jgi:hypothetical protein